MASQKFLKKGAFNVLELPIEGHIWVVAFGALINVMIAMISTEGHGDGDGCPDITQKCKQFVN